jgi:hypothetical protein
MVRRTRLNVESLEGRTLLSGLSATLTTNASSYQVGQPVHLTFTLMNASSKSVTVDEGPSTDGFIIEQNGSTVWRSNAGINPMFIEADTLQPGQSLTLNGTWNGISNVGSSAVTGPTGTFVVFDQLSPTTSTRFQITKAASSSTPTSSTGSTTTSALGSAPITTPVVSTLADSSSTSKHRHADHDSAHHAMPKVSHATQSLIRKHHEPSGRS